MAKRVGRTTLYIAPLLIMFSALFLGRYHVGFSEVTAALMKFLHLSAGEVADGSYSVVSQLRLPRIIASAFVGAGLAASGTAFQGIFRNPLVSPSLLGVSAGAGFGASLAILLFSSLLTTYLFAFIFGLLAVALSCWIARIYKTVPLIMLILGGTIVSSIFSALISLLKFMADPERQLPAIVYWIMGSLSSVGFKEFWAFIPIAIGTGLIMLCGWKINVLSMGDKEAQTMGIDVRVAKRIIILGATLATAGAVCISGMIGWIGLIIPHIGRMVVGNDNRKLIPVSMAAGASFMIIVDTVSRIIIESEIPLGILTALIGAPFFIFLLKKTKGGGWSQ